MIKIRQIVPNEVCLKCRGCCRFSEPETSWSPILLSSEVEQLMQQGYPPSLISMSKRIRPVPDPRSDSFLCAFLSPDENACRIYGSRPLDCCLYPLMINRKDKLVFLACDLRCPFVEKNLKTRVFKNYIRNVLDVLSSPSVLDLLRNNPQFIQEYSGLLDLVEIKGLGHGP